jgi:pyruvate dehydrogenase E2 component (dihydrolipoamide acetyltransferase)
VTERLLASPYARRVAREAQVDLTIVTGTGPGGRIVSEDVEELLLAGAAGSVDSVGTVDSVNGVTSPLVRKQAREAGIDLNTVRGSGPGGKIRREDVSSASSANPDRTRAVERSVPAPQVIAWTGMRATIARRMRDSLQEMAQLTHGFEVTMDAVVALRTQLKSEWSAQGLAVPSLNDFIVRAAALALIEHPGLNASVEDDGIHLHQHINVGIAVAVEGGLMVPVVTGAATRTLVDLAQETRALATGARAGRLSLAQLEGATFVVTSLGGYDIDFFTPIVNPGNVAILGVGRLRDGVRWEGETPRRSQVLTLSLSFDHRAVDGAPAAQYLQTVGALLGQPFRLLAG